MNALWLTNDQMRAAQIAADRVAVTAMVGGAELNTHITIIMSAVTALLDTTMIGSQRELLLDVSAAAQRCGWVAMNLLQLAERRGLVPTGVVAMAKLVVMTDEVTRR